MACRGKSSGSGEDSPGGRATPPQGTAKVKVTAAKKLDADYDSTVIDMYLTSGGPRAYDSYSGSHASTVRNDYHGSSHSRSTSMTMGSEYMDGSLDYSTSTRTSSRTGTISINDYGE